MPHSASRSARRRRAVRALTRALLASPLLASVGSGCAAQTASFEPVARLIVRFRPDVLPVEPASLAAVARRADVAGLDLLRPMSGGSYVLTMRCSAPSGSIATDPCAEALARLAAVDTVIRAEFDGRVHHRSAPPASPAK